MEINTKKKFTASLSIVSNVTLSALKITAGIISGSLSIISEAIHSLSDLLASLLTMFSVIKSSKPADEDHPYGHGKYEDMSGFIEGLLIIFASFFIIFEASKKIIFSETTQLESTIGIWVMLLAVIVNSFVSSVLIKTAKETDSISLYADGEHIRTDIYSSLGVFLGLVLIKITGYSILDPIVAIIVAVFIFKAGFTISKKALMNLLDHSLSAEEIKRIKEIIQNCSSDVKLKDNSIKARQVGPSKDIDFILLFEGELSICECHKICEEIEIKICKIYPNCSISIHSEPICYKTDCLNYCEKQK